MYKIFSVHNTRFVFFLLVAAVLTSCHSAKHSKTKRLPGNWQAAPITIDGDSKDWPSPYPEYDEKAMLGYAVSNDKDNLYLTVETGDPATQLKILREGLTVWIDRKGEKNEETAINYPIPMTNYNTTKKDGGDGDRPAPMHLDGGQQGMGRDMEQKQRMDLEDKIRAAMPKATQFSLQGFKSCNLQFDINEKDSCGVEVRLGLDSMNEMVWEAKIPFKAFYFKPEIIRSDKGKPLTVIFETVGVKRPEGQNGGNRGSGGGGGMRPSVGFGGMGGMGMGMRMGGGGGGMHNRGGSNNQQSNIMEPMYKSTKTYKKFGLAFQ